jgi:hypothetical protein
VAAKDLGIANGAGKLSNVTRTKTNPFLNIISLRTNNTNKKSRCSYGFLK